MRRSAPKHAAHAKQTAKCNHQIKMRRGKQFHVLNSQFLGLCALFILIFFGTLFPLHPLGGVSNKDIVLLEINGPIGPATQEYIHEGIDHAIAQQAQFVILRLDTPGGLDKAMRQINKDILASPLPIVSYVAPSGARAASAGTYILYASHIAAMAPSTNLGASTPIGLQFNFFNKHEASDPLTKKMMNDFVAYIKSLALLRNRNSEWAEKTVREGASLPSEDALKLGVINFIAKDIPDLLQQLNGQTLVLQNQEKTLTTQDARIEYSPPNWHLRLLMVITDPAVAYLLLLLGLYGLFFEFLSPGYVLPGVVGVISLLLALYAFQLIPTNYTGLALILVGIAFLAAELFIPSYGILSAGGILAFVIGSILLLNLEGYPFPWGLILGMTVSTVSFFLIILGLALRVRRQKIVSGYETLPGTTAIVLEDFKGQGWVKVGGESWKAYSSSALKRNQRVVITKAKGLELNVEPLKNKGNSHA